MSAAPRKIPRWRDDPAAWIVALFAANFVLMRVSFLPNASLPIATPMVLLWCLAGWWRGVLAPQTQRLAVWLLAAGASALVGILQPALVPGATVSLSSWALWVVLWLPMVFAISQNDRETFLRACRGVAWVGIGVAVLSILFVLIAVLGVPYQDYFATYFPKSFQVAGFATTVPIEWGSPIYKSNAFLALEPSFVSFILGTCILAALVSRMRWWVIPMLLVGLFTSFAGSGLMLLLIGGVMLVLTGQIRQHLRVIAGGAIAFLIAAWTPVGTVVFSRVNEFGGGQDSSAALRSSLPYDVLIPRFAESIPGILLGYGAGASRRIIDGVSVLGLLVPNPAKVIFDYGLFAGGLLLLVIIAAHLRTPYLVLTVPFLISLLFLQAASQPMLIIIFALATWWAPTSGDSWVEGSSAARRGRGASMRGGQLGVDEWDTSTIAQVLPEGSLSMGSQLWAGMTLSAKDDVVGRGVQSAWREHESPLSMSVARLAAAIKDGRPTQSSLRRPHGDGQPATIGR